MALIKLARKLGLIETIYVDGLPVKSTAKSRKLQQQMQPYEYIIAVDFEATCWENAAPPRWRQCEIIEFSAVLANVKTGKVEAEFQKYIMPIESPKLSEYCIKMTGITQKIVDNGIPLQTALIMFQEWLRKELRARNLMLPKQSKDNLTGNVAFVTWSDLEAFLSKECQRKNLKKAPFFNQWIDIKTIYRQWYKIIPKDFEIALANAGLSFEGNMQSGVDEAKNLAALTHKMVSEGATLHITSDLNPLQQNMNFVL